MLVVITHDAPVIAAVQRMVDVRKLVTSHLALHVNPNFTSKLTIATFLRDVMHIVNNFSISHDSWYYACSAQKRYIG